ncbi:MAG: NAD(P)H-hydrate dehydratase [Acidobacteriota bacterium]|nr:NAD(P)H-hydrate dehydratase [Acidobacteriota bacterium]
MRPVLTSKQMAASDRYTIDQLGVPGLELMERAATGCFQVLRDLLTQEDIVAVMVGAGNNGGDGLAVARLLIQAGFQVETFLAFPQRPFKGDAAVNEARLRDMGAVIHAADVSRPIPERFTCIVDALFGTGLDRPLTGDPAALVRRINEHRASVLAVDMPSGLSGSRADIIGETVLAHITVTFQAAKIAHALTPAAAYCGKLVVHPIGIQLDPEIRNPPQLMEADDFKLPPRLPHAHKGSFGTLGIIGGFRGMEGAANLAAVAGLRFGAGKVRVLTDAPGGRFRHDSVMVDHIDHYRDEFSALVIGPGLSRRQEVSDAVNHIRREHIPVIWDADGLYYLADHPDTVLGKESILTPHPGEAGMLLGLSAREVQKDRLTALNALGERFPESWILLKGYRTLIRSPGGTWFSCATGNPALATAGSGDVLSGMIGALLACGTAPGEAVRQACIRHGMAADRWVSRHAVYSMLAEDIIDDLKD